MSLPPPPGRPAPAVPVRRPMHRGIWLGATILILGAIGAGIWFIASMPSVSDEIDRFHRASPELPTEFTIAERVDWGVFIEPSVASQSSFRYEILETNAGRVELGRSDGSTYAWFGRSGRSIASVVLDPGTYRLRVIEGTSTVAVGPDPGGAIFRAIAGALLILVLVGGSGLTVLIVSAVKDTRRRNQRGEPPPPSPWSAGEWPEGEWPAGPGR